MQWLSFSVGNTNPNRKEVTMKVSKAARLWINYHKANSQLSTVQAYEGTISKFVDVFGRRDMDAVSTDEFQEFLEELTEGRKQQTKKIRYSHIKPFSTGKAGAVFS